MQKTAPENSAFFARIEGRVQGVGFRYSCVNEAKRLGLSGWVRNTQNGDVEVWAEGPEDKLKTMLQWLHRGPPGARVDRVNQDTIMPTAKYRGFTVQ